MKKVIVKIWASLFMTWKPIWVIMPKEDETVWLLNKEKNFIALGCKAWTGEGWIWAVSNGIIYAENNLIVSECEEDDYEFTHFARLPKLPKSKKS